MNKYQFLGAGCMVYQVLVHVVNDGDPKKWPQLAQCSDKGKLIRGDDIVNVENHCLHQRLEVFSD